MQRGERSALRSCIEAVLMFVISFIFFNMDFFTIFFILPLLLYAINNGERKAILLIVLEVLLIIVTDSFMISDSLTTKLGFALLLIDLYIPLSLSAAGIVWLRTRGERRLLRRLLFVLLPAIILVVPAAAFILSDRALSSAVYTAYGNAFAAVLSPMLSLVAPGVDVSVFIDLILITVTSFLFPVLLCGICATCFIYESALHSRESDWEESVMRFSFPQDAIWGFIISWALVLILRFVSAPMLLEIAVMNAALVWTVFYAIQGFTVIFARIRRRHRTVKSMTVLIVLVIMSLLIPGINFIILLGVPLLGVLENFFDLKKIGVQDEDHS